MLGKFLRSLNGYARLMRLDKPIGIWLLLWPTLWALWIAGDGQPSQTAFMVLVLGTIVARSAGCVINDYADRNIDGQVKRTSSRPLATGEIAPAEALILFAGLMLIALGLVLALNSLALVLACGGAAITILYPFTKRFFSAPQFVLGFAFAFGVLIAFAAQNEEISRMAGLLFIATIVWVVIYDTQYAMVDRDDDADIGINSTAILLGDMDRFFIAVMYAVFLATLVLVGRSAELGIWYYAGLGIALLLAIYQLWLIRHGDPQSCFRAFLNNAWLGGWIFAGLALDYVFTA